jgi:L-amino acid N-acyltransferase YncA
MADGGLNFTIRIAAGEDAAQIAAIYAPFVRNTPTSFEMEPPDEEEIRRRLRETLRVYPWLVAERAGEVLGYVYASSHRSRAAYQWCVETTAYVKEGARRCGLGRRLYGTLFPILGAQGFRNAYAGIALPNPGSVGLHEAVGFELVGIYRAAGYKLGAWHDVGWWQRRLGSPDAEPQPPIPFAELREAPEIADGLRRA